MSNHSGLILMYHHVSEAQSDAGALSVAPQHFAEQLEILRRAANPVPLQQLMQHISSGLIRQRSVVVTFDDGYADNLCNAKPLLERYEIPATVYITTRPLHHVAEFWWDELERLLLHPGSLPPRLDLHVNGQGTMHWDLGEAASYSEDDCSKLRTWRAWDEPPTTRHSLYNALRQLLLPMDTSKQQALMDEIRRWTGAEGQHVGLRSPLSENETIALSHGDLVDIGAHTVTHPMLSTLPRDAQHREIMESKAELERLLDRPVTSFAYPYGDYSDQTPELVRELGFACACSILSGSVQPDVDLFRLPRYQVYDWDGDEFAKWLRLKLAGT